MFLIASADLNQTTHEMKWLAATFHKTPESFTLQIIFPILATRRPGLYAVRFSETSRFVVSHLCNARESLSLHFQEMNAEYIALAG